MENTANTSKVWEDESAALCNRILDYIERNGPTKTSRLRDVLKKDVDVIKYALDILQKNEKIIGVKPAQVYIWALPETVRSAEEEILSKLSGTELEREEICTGSNKNMRLFKEGALMGLVRKGKVAYYTNNFVVHYHLPAMFLTSVRDRPNGVV